MLRREKEPLPAAILQGKFEYVDLVLKNLSPDVIEQYQTEERTTMAYRVIASRKQLMELLTL